MIKPILLATTICLSGLACQSARVIDSSGKDAVVTSGEINIQDWANASKDMINSLVHSGLFPAGQRKVIMVSTVRNATMSHIDTDLLTKKIRVQLNKSGRIMTSTVLQGEDAGPDVVRDLRQNDEFKQSTIPGKNEYIAPSYSLSGKIIQLNANSGRTSQSSYVFQLSMTNIKTGLAEWEDEVEITKQSKKSILGW
jgi:uncharacterized protein (TIGR02722 family)